MSPGNLHHGGGGGKGGNEEKRTRSKGQWRQKLRLTELKKRLNEKKRGVPLKRWVPEKASKGKYIACWGGGGDRKKKNWKMAGQLLNKRGAQDDVGGQMQKDLLGFQGKGRRLQKAKLQRPTRPRVSFADGKRRRSMKVRKPGSPIGPTFNSQNHWGPGKGGDAL